MRRISLVSITIGCWVLRKISALTALGDFGIRREAALFSGTTESLANLPGALAWFLYSPSVQPLFE
jgi:hypothetical protein